MPETPKRCLCEAAPRYSFMRIWYCSLAPGHDLPHRAYVSHEIGGEIAWVGPWVDGSAYPTVEEAFREEEEAKPMIHLTREEIMAGLREGRTLCIDRRDSPVLPICLDLEREGLITTELVQLDEQSSVLKVRWRST